MTLNTIAASSAVRVMGPTRSCDHASTIPPWRLTRPNVGRSAAQPQAVAGETIDPDVSVPIPNATHPAAVADAGPAEEPLELWLKFHGFFVPPPNQLPPCANWPVDNFAINTAPALRRR